MFTKQATASCILVVLLLVSTVAAETRNPAVAGSFYPNDPVALEQLIDDHLGSINRLPEIDGRIVALVVPHAGLVYSGQIAAHAFKLLEEREVNTLILCGPSHRYRLDGLSVWGPDVQWQTPLGMIDCNKQLCEELIRFDKRIAAIPEAHASEHCLEVQLPYIQRTLDRFSIVPVVTGAPTPSNISLLTEALGAIDIDEHTVMVASTDWQHYRPASSGWIMDSLGIDCLKNLDGIRLKRLLSDGRVEACGGGALVAVIEAAKMRGADRVKILKYGDSGDIFGDKSKVVGYVAAVLYASEEPSGGESEDRAGQIKNEGTSMTDVEKPNSDEYLSEAEKEQLLKIARATIVSHLDGKGIPEFEVSGVLADHGAAFVTLEKNEKLRGCIGYTEAVAPLYQTVTNCAVSAATRDPRFPPVTATEVSQLHIEISVLTPLTEINALDDIVVGRDGLMIVMGGNRGLLLPQVATDYGWNRTQFLEHTCQKAGLPTDAYRNPAAVIYTFTALVFGE